MNIFKLKQFIFVGLCILLFAEYGYCGFRATIHAEGEYIGGQNQADVVFGIGPHEIQKKKIPVSPGYSCDMAISDPATWEHLKEWIQAIGQAQYIWLIQFDPHGDAKPETVPRTSTMSWNPDEFGPGSVELRGISFNQQGKLVPADLIADMKKVTSYSLTDTMAYHPFVIIYKPDYLTEIIKTLQLLTNFKE